MMNRKNHIKEKILVVGLGYRTGLAAANYLAKRGDGVVVSDSKNREELSPLMEKLEPSVEVVAGGQEPGLLDRGFDRVILSPGVPTRIPLVQEALRRGVPVISEIELACRNMEGDILAVTGTDGKSTTTVLTEHLLRECGYDARSAGNIGTPLISLAGKTGPCSVTVVELSSYQLETIDTFHPSVAALLNMSPDHLDRYPSLDAYYNAKTRIAMNQNEKDVLVVNGDDPEVLRRTAGVSSRRCLFSLNEGDVQAWIRENRVYCIHKHKETMFLPVNELPILGPHNIQNVLASLLIFLSLVERRGDSFSIERVRSALKSFQGLPHRMEKVGEVKGRLFINDSKATTVSATSMALQGLEKVVLLAGGETKGDDYTRLVSSMKGKVRSVVLMGDEQEYFREVFSSFNTLSSSAMEDAVRLAFDVSKSGDAILLSPACASFDWFSGFEERGDAFRKAVGHLQEGTN